MKRYNIWNIIFHNSEVNKNIEDYKFQQSLVNSYEYWLTKIGNREFNKQVQNYEMFL